MSRLPFLPVCFPLPFQRKDMSTQLSLHQCYPHPTTNMADSVDAVLVQLMAAADGQWCARLGRLSKAIAAERASALAQPTPASTNPAPNSRQAAEILKSNKEIHKLRSALGSAQRDLRVEQDTNDQLRAQSYFALQPAPPGLPNAQEGTQGMQHFQHGLRCPSPPRSTAPFSRTTQRAFRNLANGESSATGANVTALQPNVKRSAPTEPSGGGTKKIKVEGANVQPPAVRLSEPVCNGCLGSFTSRCDHQPTCSCCAAKHQECVYRPCERGMACATSFCSAVHEDQWSSNGGPRWDIESRMEPPNPGSVPVCLRTSTKDSQC